MNNYTPEEARKIIEAGRQEHIALRDVDAIIDNLDNLSDLAEQLLKETERLSGLIEDIEWYLVEAHEMLVSDGALPLSKRKNPLEDNSLAERALRNIELAMGEIESRNGGEDEIC
jgi:hypothetical protein